MRKINESCNQTSFKWKQGRIHGWAGAILEVTRPFGQKQQGQRNKIIKKVKCDLPTDKAGNRVACTRQKIRPMKFKWSNIKTLKIQFIFSHFESCKDLMGVLSLHIYLPIDFLHHITGLKTVNLAYQIQTSCVFFFASK